MPMVEVSDLWVQYGRTVAVKGVSFAIPRGAVFGFIGPNGAGKTSTIKVLATLLRPAAGIARVKGINTCVFPERIRSIIGYMPDSFGVYEDLTVNEYLHFFAAAYRLDRDKRRVVVGDVLALTDLAEKRDTQVDQLSRGMKQRLGLARVLLHDPEVLLLDEPSSGLDPRARIEIRELIKELSNMGKTILVSSHILHELSQLCTRIGIIEAGKLVAEGALEDIYTQLGVLRTVHVRISNLTPQLLQRVNSIPGVIKVEQLVDRVALQVEERQLPLEDLLARLVGLEARMNMFQPEAMDMETVFMKLTKGKTT